MKQPSLLIVDDDHELLDSMESWFKRHGYDVTAAHHPRLAMATVAYNDFDAAIIDVQLNEMNGLELLGELKALKQFPVIMLTGDDNPKLAQAANDNGVFRHLVKPMRMAQLEEIVDEAIQAKVNG